MNALTKEELKLILEEHQKWVDTRFNLEVKGTRANLTRANLTRANLDGANLTGANLTGANLTRANLDGANLTRANLTRANLDGANLTGANLTGANLDGANLDGANLDGADYSSIYNDFMEKLALQKEEVVGLFKAVIDGKIDGSTYEGECACFVGTLAKVKACHFRDLTVKAQADSPTERFFLAIRKGDTPENNRISAIVADWIVEFLLENEMDVPQREITWN